MRRRFSPGVKVSSWRARPWLMKRGFQLSLRVSRYVLRWRAAFSVRKTRRGLEPLPRTMNSRRFKSTWSRLRLVSSETLRPVA